MADWRQLLEEQRTVEHGAKGLNASIFWSIFFVLFRWLTNKGVEGKKGKKGKKDHGGQWARVEKMDECSGVAEPRCSFCVQVCLKAAPG